MKTHALGTKMKSFLVDNPLVKRASDRVVRAVLAFVDTAEEKGTRKAVAESVKKKRTTGATGRKAGARTEKAETGEVRRKAATARERRMPEEIKTTGGHGLSADVVRRAGKNSGDFKPKKGKR